MEEVKLSITRNVEKQDVLLFMALIRRLDHQSFEARYKTSAFRFKCSL